MELKYKYGDRVKVNKGFFKGQVGHIHAFYISGLFRKKIYYKLWSEWSDQYFLEEDLDVLG